MDDAFDESRSPPVRVDSSIYGQDTENGAAMELGASATTVAMASSQHRPSEHQHQQQQLQHQHHQQQQQQHASAAHEQQMLLVQAILERAALQQHGTNSSDPNARREMREEPEGQRSRHPVAQPLGRIVTGMEEEEPSPPLQQAHQHQPQQQLRTQQQQHQPQQQPQQQQPQQPQQQQQATMRQQLLEESDDGDDLSSLSEEGKKYFNIAAQTQKATSHEGLISGLSEHFIKASARSISCPQVEDDDSVGMSEFVREGQEQSAIGTLYRPIMERVGVLAQERHDHRQGLPNSSSIRVAPLAVDNSSDRLRPLQTSTPVPNAADIGDQRRSSMERRRISNGVSQVSSSARSSSTTSMSVARILEMATVTGEHGNTTIDYDRLRELMKENTRANKAKLEREKERRRELEDLLMLYGKRKLEKRRSRLANERSSNHVGESRSINKSSSERGSEINNGSRNSTTTTTDTVNSSDLLAELVWRKLHKKRRTLSRNGSANGYSSVERESRECSLTSSVGEGAVTPNPTRDESEIIASVSAAAVATDNRRHQATVVVPENFYQSTSLFGYGTATVERVRAPMLDAVVNDGNSADRAANSENGNMVEALRNTLNHQPPSIQTHVRYPPPIPSTGPTGSRAYATVPAIRASAVLLPLQQQQQQQQQRRKVQSVGWRWVSFQGMSTEKMPPALTEVLVHKRPDFLARSTARKRRIEEASRARDQVQKICRQLAEEVAVGRLSVEEGNELIRLEQQRNKTSAFPLKQMINDTKRRVYNLPEYRAKREKQARELEMATNRAMAKMYRQQLVYQAMMVAK